MKMKMNIAQWTLVLLTMLPTMLQAQDIKKVSGEFTYYADANMSLKDAKAAAIENARLQAIAQEFGTVITQNTETREQLSDGKEDTFFQQINSSEVKGEWLEDTKEPSCEVVEVLSDMIVLKSKVSGKARAISNESAEFDVKVLRNGTDRKFAATTFNEGDDMYVSFKASVSGYVAIYLIDEEPTAFCLLPYSADESGEMKVVRGKEHIFFSSQHAPKELVPLVEEMSFTCSDERAELNQLYVVFSPNPFSKAMDIKTSSQLPRQLTYKDFTRWLSKCRKRDPKMGVQIIKLTINKAS